jgi:branched-chain amino acid transport system ATP-binding protein
LAPRIAEQVFETIKTIRGELRPILIVEQDIASTLAIADYAYVMENGGITVEGTPAELADNSDVLASYLGGQAL